MKIVLDKIASSTRNARVGREVRLGPDIPARAGVVVAAEVLAEKAVYNTLEDPHGRQVKLHRGDRFAGVLGHRSGLRGYTGVVPDAVRAGDVLQLLNLGGVVGRCTSAPLELGEPFPVRVLGSVLTFPYLGERVGVPADIREGALPWAERLGALPPLIVVSGTAMSAGKTSASAEIIKGARHRGHRVGGVKATGVSLLADSLVMLDSGAARAVNFTDAGLPSTRPADVVPVSKGLLNEIARDPLDLIVLELGDGILGEYGVREFLHDPELSHAVSVHVVCANDPVGAWGAVKLFGEWLGRSPDVISGPATDNDVGKAFIRSLGLPAFNSRTDGDLLAADVLARAGVADRRPPQAAGVGP